MGTGEGELLQLPSREPSTELTVLPGRGGIFDAKGFESNAEAGDGMFDRAERSA